MIKPSDPFKLFISWYRSFTNSITFRMFYDTELFSKLNITAASKGIAVLGYIKCEYEERWREEECVRPSQVGTIHFYDKPSPSPPPNFRYDLQKFPLRNSMHTTTCFECQGAGEITCDRCGGEGYVYMSCHVCGGSGYASKTCPTCGGMGYVGFETCSTCNGWGRIEELCSTCGGMGRIREVCPKCDGKGKVTCPVCEGERELVYFTSEYYRYSPKDFEYNVVSFTVRKRDHKELVKRAKKVAKKGGSKSSLTYDYFINDMLGERGDDKYPGKSELRGNLDEDLVDSAASIVVEVNRELYNTARLAGYIVYHMKVFTLVPYSFIALQYGKRKEAIYFVGGEERVEVFHSLPKSKAKVGLFTLSTILTLLTLLDAFSQGSLWPLLLLSACPLWLVYLIVVLRSKLIPFTTILVSSSNKRKASLYLFKILNGLSKLRDDFLVQDLNYSLLLDGRIAGTFVIRAISGDKHLFFKVADVCPEELEGVDKLIYIGENGDLGVEDIPVLLLREREVRRGGEELYNRIYSFIKG